MTRTSLETINHICRTNEALREHIEG